MLLTDKTHFYGLRAHKSLFGMHQDEIAAFNETCKKSGRRGVFVTVGYGAFDAQLQHVSVISDRKLVSTIRSHPKVRAKFAAKS